MLLECDVAHTRVQKVMESLPREGRDMAREVMDPKEVEEHITEDVLHKRSITRATMILAFASTS